MVLYSFPYRERRFEDLTKLGEAEMQTDSTDKRMCHAMKYIDPSLHPTFNPASCLAQQFHPLIPAKMDIRTTLENLTLGKISLLACYTLVNKFERAKMRHELCLNFVRLVEQNDEETYVLYSFQRISDGETFQLRVLKASDNYMDFPRNRIQSYKNDGFDGLTVFVWGGSDPIMEDADGVHYRFQGQYDTIIDYFIKSKLHEERWKRHRLKTWVEYNSIQIAAANQCFKYFETAPIGEPITLPSNIWDGNITAGCIDLAHLKRESICMDTQGKKDDLVSQCRDRLAKLENDRLQKAKEMQETEEVIKDIEQHGIKDIIWLRRWVLKKMYDPGTEMNKWFREIYLRRLTDRTQYVDKYTFQLDLERAAKKRKMSHQE